MVGYFSGSNGVRQGDPISPYLFVLAMDVLSQITQQRVHLNADFRFHWRCHLTNTTQLLFADDLIFFSHGDRQSVDILAGAFDSFLAVSGLEVNLSKSTLFFSSVAASEMESIQGRLGFPIGQLPVRYLGVPMLSTKLKHNDCRALIDRITSRVQSWLAKSLSYAGRLQLIISVLHSIQGFWASLLILPSSVLKAIERILKNFLWSGSEVRRAVEKVSWKQIGLPKEEGGLGIKNLRLFNKCLMAKHLWLIVSGDEHSTWVSWIQKFLLKNRSVWSLAIPGDCSWTWRKLLKLRPLVQQFVEHRIGDGQSTSLWFDPWLECGPLVPTYGQRIVYDSAIPLHAKVSAVILESEWCWPSVQTWELMEIQQLLPPLPTPLQPDRVLWKPTGACYTVASAWDALRPVAPRKFWAGLVWHKHHVPRFSFIYWLAAQNRLQTKDLVARFNPSVRRACLLCQAVDEDHDHLLFRCSYSQQVLFPLLEKAGVQTSALFPLHWDSFLVWAEREWRRDVFNHILCKFIVAAFVYYLWKERNGRVFANKFVDARSLYQLIKTHVRGWLMGLPLPDSALMRDIRLGWDCG